MAALTATRIRVGISSCLLGLNVRYDGGNCLDPFITDTLGRYAEFVPVCPEVECGLSVPREPLHLVGDPAAPRLVTRKTRVDYTDHMLTWVGTKVTELEAEQLSGFIFKSRSPSSGMERVKVYTGKGMPEKKGVGLFARAFMEHFPLLPVEDEGRLHDPKLRENFIESIFVFGRWREMLRNGPTRGAVLDFHTRHKLLLRSHSPEHHTRMGKLVAAIRDYPIRAFCEQYQSLLLDALKRKTTVKKNVDVLFHCLGYFKKELAADEKRELIDVVENYRQGHLPLIVPVTLIAHFVRKYDQTYLMQQYYLNPHPLELRLRNHA